MGHVLTYGQGDKPPSDEAERIEQHFTERYKAGNFWGVVTIGLQYTAGRGYHVAEATVHSIAVGNVAPGGALPVPDPPRDYRDQVAKELVKLGLTVY